MQLENKTSKVSSQKSGDLKQRSRSVFREPPMDMSFKAPFSTVETDSKNLDKSVSDAVKPRKRFIFNPKPI